MNRFSALRSLPVAAVLLLAACVTVPSPLPSIVAPPVPRPAKVAIVLGSGAAKGFAHIGVLKVLEGQNIPVSMIVGTSAGSFVGALYASGYDAYALQTMALGIERDDVAEIGIPDVGFVKGERLEAFVNKAVKNVPIEKLKIPFYAVATNLHKGQETVFGRGNTGQAVRASCSVPGVFRPVRIGDALYVDGGVVSPVAVDAAHRMGADVVIAVDISGGGKDNPDPTSTIDAILTSINIMYARLSERQLEKADVVIRPKVGHIASGDFTKRHEAILEGEKAASAALSKIREILEPFRKAGRLP